MIVTTFPSTVRVIEHSLTSLKDSVTLADRIWLPEDAERNPVPAILEYPVLQAQLALDVVWSGCRTCGCSWKIGSGTAMRIESTTTQAQFTVVTTGASVAL